MPCKTCLEEKIEVLEKENTSLVRLILGLRTQAIESLALIDEAIDIEVEIENGESFVTITVRDDIEESDENPDSCNQ